MIKKFLPIAILAGGFPGVAFAVVNTAWLDATMTVVIAFLQKLPAFFVAVAAIYFLWGVLKFVAAGDNEEARVAGKKSMIWGIIGITIMLSFWGIIELIVGALDLDVNPPSTPDLPTP
ncbi:MAG: hypothetical protein KAS07_02015 [Candidatus Pacebacteria bacterium]|nr:hypothetical protein [Candidatus Paceibacterota bacterium]